MHSSRTLIMPCSHPDVRKFDGIRCCLACGEAVFEPATTSSTSPRSEYQYRRLNYTLGQEIRLIELLPTDKLSDAVRCRMHHVNLEDDPAYEAVSYTWATEGGDARPCRYVQFADGNGSITVTQNCEAALRRLRKRGCSRHLWVDAICIDQTNTSERNHQVGLMDKIFSRAWRVMMCLQDEHLHAPVDYARLFQRLDTGDRLRSSEILTLDRLISARYFKRVWIIQEVALARSAYLKVNDQELPLSPCVLRNLENFCSEHNFKIPSVLRWVPSQESEYEVIRCLEIGADCQATDPRDRVFALLSLMKPSVRALVPVDYSMNITAVHAYIRIAAISTSHSLDLIRHLQNRKNSDGSMRLSLRYTQETRFRLVPQFTSADAGIWRPNINAVIQGSVEVSDTTTSNLVHTVSFEKPDSDLSDYHLPRFWARAHYLDTITNTTFCRRHGTRCGCNLYERQAVSGSYNIPERLVRRKDLKCFGWMEDYFRGVNSRKGRKNRRADSAIPLSTQIHLQRFFRQVHSGSGQGWMFATRYSLGYAGTGFEAGDQIFAIDGASVPFILRQIGRNQYNLVGECYLWAALELHRWKPGTKRGRWWSSISPQTLFPEESAGQTRIIEIHTPTVLRKDDLT
jgi:hypothetical protein